MKTILTSLCIVAASATFAQVGISETVNFTPNTNVNGDILTQDTSPVMLDVDGKTRVRTMPIAEPNTYSTVVRDNETGVLKILSDLYSGNKPINYTTYRIENMNQDWVSNFNTLIPADQWSMAVIGWRFKNPTGGQGFIVTNRQDVRKNIYDNYGGGSSQNFQHWEQFQSKYDVSASPNVYAFKSGGTWRLSADFLGSGTNGKLGNQTTVVPIFGNGYWELDVLIIDNSLVNVLGSPTPTNLNNGTTGSASSNVLD